MCNDETLSINGLYCTDNIPGFWFRLSLRAGKPIAEVDEAGRPLAGEDQRRPEDSHKEQLIATIGSPILKQWAYLIILSLNNEPI